MEIKWQGDLDNKCHAIVDDYALFVEWRGRGAWWMVKHGFETVKESNQYQYAPSMWGGRVRAKHAMENHQQMIEV